MTWKGIVLLTASARRQGNSQGNRLPTPQLLPQPGQHPTPARPSQFAPCRSSQDSRGGSHSSLSFSAFLSAFLSFWVRHHQIRYTVLLVVRIRWLTLVNSAGAKTLKSPSFDWEDCQWVPLLICSGVTPGAEAPYLDDHLMASKAPRYPSLEGSFGEVVAPHCGAYGRHFFSFVASAVDMTGSQKVRRRAFV